MPTYMNLNKTPDQPPRFEKTYGDILMEVEPSGAIKILGPAECISERQNGWLHCKDGPIMYLVGEGWEFYDAKRYLKVKFGRKIFVRDMTDKNCTKAKGEFFWECRVVSCRKLVYPWQVMYSNVANHRICPHCMQPQIYPIILKSINQVAPSRIRVWNESIWEAYPDIKKPDPERNNNT